MAVTYNDNIETNAPKPLDNRYEKFSGGKGVRFASIAEANAANPPSQRHEGLTVLVDVAGIPVEHWYIGADLTLDPVVKNPVSTGGGTEFEEVDY